MYFPYRRLITIEDLYDMFTYYESSELPELRAYFRQLSKYSWRVIPRSSLFSGKLTFTTFADFYQFVKFAYIVYPNFRLTLLYQSNETYSKLPHRPLESH